MVSGSNTKELFGGAKETTNNRMELSAVIQGLAALNQPCDVTIYTDSTYVMKGASEWMIGWKKRNWRAANKKPVKNVDLWQRLDTELERHQIEWHWVKGHSGHEGNERADQLANMGVDEQEIA